MKRDINVIGIDIAKRRFQVIGMDTTGHNHLGVTGVLEGKFTVSYN